jgi:hypothetical protein
MIPHGNGRSFKLRLDPGIEAEPTPGPSEELCITHKFLNRSPSNPNGIPPQSPGLGGTTYPGNNVQEAFSTPKVLRQSSAIWAQPRWGCFEAGLEPKVGQPLSRKANLGLEGVIPLG